MPLSDHEKKLLAEMEEALAADDPRLLSTFSGKTPSRSGRNWLPTNRCRASCPACRDGQQDSDPWRIWFRNLTWRHRFGNFKPRGSSASLAQGQFKVEYGF